jgi:hypothetical protein
VKTKTKKKQRMRSYVKETIAGRVLSTWKPAFLPWFRIPVECRVYMPLDLLQRGNRRREQLMHNDRILLVPIRKCHMHGRHMVIECISTSLLDFCFVKPVTKLIVKPVTKHFTEKHCPLVHLLVTKKTIKRGGK